MKGASKSVSKKSSTDPQNDRERIAAAFVELSERGYNTALFAPWEVCCTSCGWAEVRSQLGLPNDAEDDEAELAGKKTVWWHEQSDSLAFGGNAGEVLHTDAFYDQIPEDEDEAQDWFEEHADEVMADEVLARTTEYVNLCSTLYLHWWGDADEIVAALRAQGLRATRPESEATCVTVRPAVAEFEVKTSPIGEVLVRLDGHTTTLNPSEARSLARKLNAAAKRAQAEAIPEL